MPSLLNNLLRSVRVRYRPDLSQSAAASALGIWKSQIHKLEKGGLRRPTEELMEKMLDLYGCPENARTIVRNVFALSEANYEAEDAIKYQGLVSKVGELALYVHPQKAVIVSPASFDAIPPAAKGGSAVFSVPALWRLAFVALEDTDEANGHIEAWKTIFQSAKHHRIVPPQKSFCDDYADSYLVDDFVIVYRTAFGFALTADDERLEAFRRDFELFKAMAYSGNEAKAVFERAVAFAKG